MFSIHFGHLDDHFVIFDYFSLVDVFLKNQNYAFGEFYPLIHPFHNSWLLFLSN